MNRALASCEVKLPKGRSTQLRVMDGSTEKRGEKPIRPA